MYKYSLLYLALLFAAMGVDRALPFGHAARAGEVIILGRPGEELATPAGAHIHP
jgi:hypothetical protein